MSDPATEPSPLHEALAKHLRESYTAEEVGALRATLTTLGVDQVPCYETGLSPTLAGPDDHDVSLLRDLMMVGTYDLETGREAEACAVAESVLAFCGRVAERFTTIAEKPELAAERGLRPPVVFDGKQCAPIEPAPLQNDNGAWGALAGFLGHLMFKGWLTAGPQVLTVIENLLRYLEAITYWEDADAGMWGELPKLGSSSIGAVIGGLVSLQKALAKTEEVGGTEVGTVRQLQARLRELIVPGRLVVTKWLPREAVYADDPARNRDVDAALLPLIYPFEAVAPAVAHAILGRVEDQLVGDYGIRRYQGDSFWSAGYPKWSPKLPPITDCESLEAHISERDRNFFPGSEAQWTGFDALLSVIFARRFESSSHPMDYARQAHYLHRALCQIVPDPDDPDRGYVPQLFFLADRRKKLWEPNGVRVPSWSVAMLNLAVHYLGRTLPLAPTEPAGNVATR